MRDEVSLPMDMDGKSEDEECEREIRVPTVEMRRVIKKIRRKSWRM